MAEEQQIQAVDADSAEQPQEENTTPAEITVLLRAVGVQNLCIN